MSKRLVTQLLIFGGLAALCVFVSWIKIRNSTDKLYYYDPANGENFYWTESAFHFRYARMISQGHALPPQDTFIQHPEGLDTRSYITPLMERVYGQLHRWFFGDVPLHRFLIYATAIFSTFSVIACFFAASALRTNAWVGFFCACLYGLALGSLGRNYGAFIREDFALPFLFGSFACFVSCMQKERWPVAIGGAVLLIAGFASWHVSQFYYLLLVIGFALVVLIYGPEHFPRNTFTIYAAVTVVAAVLLPVLRAKHYLVSLPLMITYALIVVLWLLPRARGWSAKKIKWTSIGLICVFAAAGLMIQRGIGTHSHVFAVLWAKLRYLGTLPADPTLLSFEAKTMWTSSFVSPSANEFFILLSTSLLFGGIALIVLLPRVYRGQMTRDQALVLYNALVTLILFLMIRRMVVFAIFFLALLAAMGWPRRIVWRQIVFSVLVVSCLIFEAGKHYRLNMSPRRPPNAHIADITDFLRTHSEPANSVMTSVEMGAPVAAYANWPVVIHSKFESKGLRDKVKKIYTAFFEDEKSLYEVSKQYDARYLVYQADMALSFGPGSMRYNVGHDSLPTDSATFLFQFAPERLNYFRLVRQNAGYRVFRIGYTAGPTLRELPYEPVYDLSLFVDGDHGKTLTDVQIMSGRKKLVAARTMVAQAYQLMRAGRHSEAVTAFQRALRINSRQPGALFGLARAYEQLGRIYAERGYYKEAADAITRSLAINPDQPRLSDMLATFRDLAGGQRKPLRTP